MLKKNSMMLGCNFFLLMISYSSKDNGLFCKQEKKTHIFLSVKIVHNW